MADRDVKLIIRAKNEATRAIDSVSDALKELNRSQDDTGRSAAKADGLLSELGGEFSRLNKEVAGLNALSKVAGELGKVEQAVSGLESDLRRSAGEFAKYAREAENATANTGRLKTQTDQFRQSVEREEASLKRLRSERTQANAELRKSETAYRRLQAAIAKQRGGPTPAARSADAFLAGDVEKARAAAEQTSAAFNEQSTATRGAKNALKDHSAEVRRAESEQERLGRATRDAATETNRNRASLERSRTVLGEIRTTATSAAQALGGVAVEQRQIAEASRQTAATLDAVGAELTAMQRLSDGGGGFTSPETADAIRRQREEVDKARTAYELLEARAQRLAAAQQRIGPPTRNAVAAQRQAAEAARAAKEEMERQIAVLNRFPGAINQMRGLRGIFGGIYGESRQAMSMFQRMRGELLSLTTAYVGLYGAIQNIGGVITAYQKMEAAQNRLGAAFNQNGTAVRNELGWIERQASRLGISFGELSNQYSKFTIAASAANFENENTRKVFLAVAEAGRVNKLSLEDMTGVFRALEQMISKGKIQAEELRQQMGDRLPGAFNILASALNVSTAELNKMMETGAVLADETTLLKFADELNRRFGGQLAESLKSTTTLIGRFQNELFQAQLRVGRGGFIEGLNDALENLNTWFQSREGRDFFLSLGAALGSFVRLLGEVPKYFGLIKIAIQTFIALKFAQFIGGLSQSFVGAIGNTTRFAASLRALRVMLMGTQGAFAVAAAGARTFSAALRSIPGMFLLTGIGLIVQELLANWIGDVDDATQSLDEHQRLMSQVISAYEEAEGKVDDWAKAIEGATVTQLRASLTQIRSDIETEVDKVSKIIDDATAGPTWISTAGPAHRLTGAAKEQVETLKLLAEGLRNGAVDLEVFRRAVDDIGQRTNSKIVLELATQFLEAAENLDGLTTAADKTEASMRLIEGAATAADMAILGLEGATADSEKAFKAATDAAEGYANALSELQGMVPALAEEFKQLEALNEIDRIFEQGVADLDAMGGRNSRTKYRNLVNSRDQAIQAELLKGVSDSVAEAARLLVNKEGFRDTPYYDVNAWRVGFGSDTVTLADGSVQKVVRGMQITQADAYRDLTRRIGEFQDGIIRKIGPSVFNAFTAEQQAALTSVAYNYGSLPDRVSSVVNDGGSIEQIASAIRDLGSDNDGVNRGRRADEADMFLGSETGAQAFEYEKRKTDELRKQNEERAKEQEATSRQLVDLGFQIEQQKLIGDGRSREAAIEVAIREAKEQNKNITAEQIAQVSELTGKLYDLQNANAGVEEAEKRVNDLLQMRQELTEQIRLHQEMGNEQQVTALSGVLDGVNAQLTTAINNAIVMWRALGGPEADLAIAKLNTTKLSIEDVGKKAIISGEMIADRLAGALTNAFRAAAQAIAEGKDAWEAFSTAFLQGIAEMLIEMGQLIVRQMILNALQGLLGLPTTGPTSILGAVFHDGGVVGGTGGQTRAVSPGWFTNAVRLHEGGVAGLKAGEVPAILERGEVVDPGDGSVFRKMFGGEQQPANIKVVNTFDSADVVSEGLNSAVGEQTFLNVVRRNAGKVREMIGQ